MDHQWNKKESNYGTNRGSDTSSSFTFSSGEDTLDKHPSTSGCSSDIPRMNRRKEHKKEKVKECMRKLKELVSSSAAGGPSSSGGKTGKACTLQTLQELIGHMKKIKEQQQTAVEEAEKISSDSEAQWPLSKSEGTPESHLSLILSKNDFVILQVSEELTHLLGFPPGSWQNRDFMDYVHRRDMVKVNTHFYLKGNLADSAEKMEEDNKKSHIFLRLRKYKSLRQGFSLNKPDKFLTFRVNMSVHRLALSTESSSRTEATSGIGDSVCNTNTTATDDAPGTQYLKVDLDLITSAFTSTDTLPDERSFTTRHTVFCNFTYLDEQAIPLLGYLPQDIIGSCIFDYYHANDLPHLYNIYQQVMSLDGNVFKSEPYRFKTKNGSYIMIETEWSSYVNQWTKKLEFISGYHTVVRNPKIPDVFAESSAITAKKKASAAATNSKGGDQAFFQQNVRQLLLQPIKSNDPSPTPTSGTSSEEAGEPCKVKPQTNKHESMPPPPSKNTAKEEVRQTSRSDKMKEEPGTAAKQETEFDKYDPEQSTTYAQLNFAQNIRRFLMSCPKTISSEESIKKGSSTEDEVLGPLSATDLPVKVELLKLLPKRPQSFGSSTMVLVSEQEPREELQPPSPTRVEPYPADENSQEMPEPPSHPVYRPCALTPDVLNAHTWLQEQNYIMQTKKEYNLPNSPGPPNISQAQKRGHSPELTQSKVMRSSQGQDFGLNPMPGTSSQTEHKEKEAMGNMAAPTPSRFIQHPLFGYYVLGDGKNAAPLIPMVVPPQAPPKPASGTPQTTGQLPLPAYQWPYYPQAGVQFLPQVLGGFYQPVAGAFQPIRSHHMMTLAHSAQQTRSITAKTPAATHTVSSYSSSKMSSSGMQFDSDGTSSSLLYLLDSTSHMYSSPSNEPVGVAPLNFRKIPWWKADVQWTESLENRYTVPDRDVAETLQKDLLFLNKVRQQEEVTDQLQELLGEIDSAAQDHKPLDEEADVLFWTRSEEEREEDSQSDGSASSIDGDDNLHHSLGSCKAQEMLLQEQLKRITIKKGLKTKNRRPPPTFQLNDAILQETAGPSSTVATTANAEDKAHVEMKSVEIASRLAKTERKCDVDGMQLAGEKVNASEKSMETSESKEESNEDFAIRMKMCDIEKIEKDAVKNSNIEMTNEKRDEKSTDFDLQVENMDVMCSLVKEEKNVEMDMDNDKESDSNYLECASKGSSDVTPSDERSNAENESSLKESDGSWNNGSEESSESDMEATKTEVSADNFSKLFVLLPLRRITKTRKLAPWLRGAAFNKKVEMLYTAQPISEETEVAFTENLETYKQPHLVVDQMKELLAEIEGQESAQIGDGKPPKGGTQSNGVFEKLFQGDEKTISDIGEIDSCEQQQSVSYKMTDEKHVEKDAEDKDSGKGSGRFSSSDTSARKTEDTSSENMM